MPIHLRAEPGDYAEAVLLPGDPLRAQLIAETFFDNPRQVNGERGMLGFTGTFEGKPISVQSSGMGCPSAPSSIEELIQLGVKRIVRVGTCGGLQSDMQLGDLSSRSPPSRRTARCSRTRAASRTRPRPTSSSCTPRCTRPKHTGTSCASGPACRRARSTTPTRARRSAGPTGACSAWRWKRPSCFTIAALRRIQAGLLPHGLRHHRRGRVPAHLGRRSCKNAVARMTELAIRAALSEPKH